VRVINHGSGAMRLTVFALLSLAATTSCGGDHPIAPTVPRTPHASASLILGLNATTPLYQSTATAINDSGVVAGDVTVAIFDRPRAAVWRPPDYHVTLLPDLGAGFPHAAAIGNDGTIGGRICETAAFDSPCHPVYWRDDVLHQLGGLGEVRDVCPCDGHTLVGRTIVHGLDHGAIWEDDILIDVGVPRDEQSATLMAVARGNIVGIGYFNTLETARNIEAHRWSPVSGWVRMGNTEFGVADVTSHGSAIGGFSLFWPNGSNTPTSIPGEAEVVAINDSGVVVGDCVPSPPGSQLDFRPCEWTSTSGWRAIGSESFAAVRDINNSNMAVGELFDQGRSFAILWVP
jgi:hypothetical protein